MYSLVGIKLAKCSNNKGETALFYHAGLDSSEKDERQKAWQSDEARIMVATNAFGMGIDKPDVRLVIHIDCPDSLEAYFQEAGRAGRDGQRAYAVLLYNGHDEVKLKKRINDTFPEKDFIKDVYEHLAYFFQIGVGSGCGKTFIFDIETFCFTYKFFPTQVDSALRILENSGYIHYEDNPDGKARLKFTLNRNELYLLENLPSNQEMIITALLRTYGGLFTDYVYISENLIAQMCDISVQQVYMTLKNLSSRHIVDFIPQRKTPYITYTRQREDGNRIIIPKSVWEDRKEQYTKRIKSVITYANNDIVCRSRQLLRYFGEETRKDCGHCDVCQENSKSRNIDDELNNISEQILNMLSDKQIHDIQELRLIKAPTQMINKAVRSLIAENIVITDKFDFWLGKN